MSASSSIVASYNRYTIVSELEKLIERVTSNTEIGFVSSGCSLSEGPGLEVCDLGLLPLPINSHVANLLVSIPSSGILTAGDLHTREADSLWFDTARLRISNPSWQGTVTTYTDAIRRDLCAPAGATCIASLNGLLVSGPGYSVAQRIFKITKGTPGEVNAREQCSE